MKKKHLLPFMSMLYTVSLAQVGISKDVTFKPDSRTQFHVKQDNEAIRLPRVNTSTSLPTSDTGTIDNGTEGSIMYNKETGSIVQNDGTQWKVSDVIVTTRKNGKTARFVRNTNAVLDFGSCGNVFLGYSCTGNKEILANNNFFSFTSNTSSTAYNDISSDVSLVANPSQQIKFNTKGLYRITFKTGMANEEVPRVCVGVTSNYYTRVDLLKSTNGTVWTPIASNTSNKQVPGVLQISDLLGMVSNLTGTNNTGMANAITYTGVFNANELIRFTYYGNLNMGTAVCNPLLSGDETNMSLTFDGTDANMSEVIIEKISF